MTVKTPGGASPRSSGHVSEAYVMDGHWHLLQLLYETSPVDDIQLAKLVLAYTP